MDSNDIYEVERDEYVTFIGQLNKQMMDVEEYSQEDQTSIKIYSKATNKLLCTRVIFHDESGEEKYYIFEYPEEDEKISPRAVMKVTLDTKEQVQAFFDALNTLQKEAHKND